MVKGMKRWIVQCKPPRIAAILILLAFGRHYLLSSGGGLLYQAAGLGIFLEVLGFCIMLWAWWLFKKASTSLCPLSDDTVLVDYGIYQLTRNPMYLGLTFILLGIALIAGGLAYYIAVIVFFIIVDRAFCDYEEGKLAERFGEKYHVYQRRVRRWL